MKQLNSYLQEQFQWFHANPELSYEEFETTKRLHQLLVQADVEILPLPLETGLAAIIRGKKPGKTAALRCDIDALPIMEEADLTYRSTAANKMHACGHDFHTTTVLGAALMLQSRREELEGNVKFIFQPAEESSLGAKKIIETNVLNDVDVIFGIHVTPDLPVGTLGIKPGNVTAAVDRFAVTFRGRGCHAAHPDQGIDPIPLMAAFISSAQSIVSRNLSPFDAGLVSITHIEAGSTWNVIPESVFLEGTVRTLDTKIRTQIEERLKSLAKSIAEGYCAKCDFEWIIGPPATDNDPLWAEFAKQLALQADYAVAEPEPSLGGEDFAFYQQTHKGVFMQIGTGLSYPLHHPKFAVDPLALNISVPFCASLMEQALIKLASEAET